MDMTLTFVLHVFITTVTREPMNTCSVILPWFTCNGGYEHVDNKCHKRGIIKLQVALAPLQFYIVQYLCTVPCVTTTKCTGHGVHAPSARAIAMQKRFPIVIALLTCAAMGSEKFSC